MLLFSVLVALVMPTHDENYVSLNLMQSDRKSSCLATPAMLESSLQLVRYVTFFHVQ